MISLGRKSVYYRYLRVRTSKKTEQNQQKLLWFLRHSGNRFLYRDFC